MVFLCWLRKGSFYMPVLAKTVAGFYRGIDPVSVVPVSQTTEMHRAIAETIARGNPIIPTPSPKEADLPSLLKHAGVKTWAAFDRDALSWKIREEDGIYQIVGQRDGKYGGTVDDPDQTITFPSGARLDDVIDRMVAILQEAE